MPPRTRQVVALLVALGLLLFAGRWTAGLLTDRWWAETISPAAVAFITEWHFLRLILELAGILIASAWFIGHLLVVSRAVGSVQISRRVANLEIREALTRDVLLATAIGLGLLLGIATGTGGAGWASTVALSWRSVSFEVVEPVLGHDLGLYVAQLPLWRLLHGFALLLAGVALVGCIALYSLIGALQMTGGRPAINDHARAHLGWLLVAVALTLAWGYLLEPYELVAGLSGVPDRPALELAALVSPALTGTALMVAVMSAVWAVRPRHALVAAGWLVLTVTSLGGHYLLPAFNRDRGAPAVEPELTRRFEGLAFALRGMRDSSGSRLLRDTSPPRVAPLWGEDAVARFADDALPDSAVADPGLLAVEGRHFPVWLVSRGPMAERPGLLAVAADRIGPTGDPVYYRQSDTLGYPTPFALLPLDSTTLQPGGPAYDISRNGPGIPIDSWGRRAVLAWALQAGQLLGGVSDGARLAWRLDPEERLEALIPFVEWGDAVPLVVDNDLVWVCDGYETSATFPLVERLPWRGRAVNFAHAAFVGVVWARTGRTAVYRRADADAGPLAVAWSSIAPGMIESASRLPPGVAAALPYPFELFELQARALERPPWDAGILSGRPETGPGDPTPPTRGWRADTGGTRLVMLYERPSSIRVSAVLVAGTRAGRASLDLVRLDSTRTLPAPRALDATWGRFPTFLSLADSVRSSGAARGDSLLRGPLTVWLDPAGGLGVYRTWYAPRGNALSLAWVSMALSGRSVGAGRTLMEAWDNLRGATAPLPATVPTASLEEARKWLRLADSALKVGDWAGFGRAFDALKQVLGTHDSLSH
ncbi:MAG TPA: UPF0182 family protein [Gemmatimonadales bacterium]